MIVVWGSANAGRLALFLGVFEASAVGTFPKSSLLLIAVLDQTSVPFTSELTNVSHAFSRPREALVANMQRFFGNYPQCTARPWSSSSLSPSS